MITKNGVKAKKKTLNSKKTKKAKNKLENIKSNFILKNILNNIKKNKSLQIIKHNKKIQKRLNININDYKEYCEIYSSIDLEIIPAPNEFSKFINVKEGEEKYFHIYFNNNNKKEIKRTYLNKNDKVKKINIIIDYQIMSFEKLFNYCECIESIKFKKFHRNNINNMRDMFYYCSSLNEINFYNFNTQNVINMSYMFSG